MVRIRNVSPFKFIKKMKVLNQTESAISPKANKLAAREACLNAYSPYSNTGYVPPNYSRKYTPSDNYRFSRHDSRYN